MRRLVCSIVLALVGCATRDACPPGELAVPSGTPAFVVVRSDYGSSDIALLAADGTVLTSDFIDSGSRPAGLVTALSGDTVVPTTPFAGSVAWIGRLFVDVLTIVEDGQITEIDTRGEGLGVPHTGFTANPQDALRLDDGRILVTRLTPNPDRSAPELQLGNDVVVVEGNTITQRIPLPDDVTHDCAETDCTAYAHPAVMVPLAAGSRRVVMVVLERNSARFTAFGSGAVVAIDPATLAVSPALDLSPLENCQFASIDRDDPARAYVSCASDQNQSPEIRRPHAGIAEITLDTSGALHARVLQTSAPSPVINGGVLGIGAGRVLVVATESHSGDAPSPDHLLAMDVATSSVRDLYQTQHGFAIWSGAVVGDLALVPDHERGALVRVDVSGEPVVVGTITFDDCVDLPAFQVGRLAF